MINLTPHKPECDIRKCDLKEQFFKHTQFSYAVNELIIYATFKTYTDKDGQQGSCYVFYYAYLQPDGSLLLYETTGTETERKVGRVHKDGYTFLYNLATTQDGGVFFIPGKSQTPMKWTSLGSNLWGIELDWGTREDQLAQYAIFEEITGLNLTLVSSGNKSVHAFPKSSEVAHLKEWLYISRLFTIALSGDPAICEDKRLMRASGFPRRKNGEFIGNQELLQEGKEYSLEAIREGLERWFVYKGWKMPTPDELADIYDDSSIIKPTRTNARWQQLYKILKLKDEWRLEQKENAIREILAKSEDELNPKHTRNYTSTYTPSNNTSVSFTGSNPPLEYFLSLQNQTALAGVSSDRNNIGTRILRDLVGCESELNAKGISFTGNSYDLFIQYCQKCNQGEGWDSREWETIWRSNCNKSTGPSIGSEKLRDRWYWWQIEHDAEYAKESKRQWIEEQKKNNPDCKELDPYEELKQNVGRAKTFTADRTEDEQHLQPFDYLTLNGQIAAFNAHMGSGKTYQLGKYLEKNQADFTANNVQISYINSRLNLQRQFIADVNRVLKPSSPKFIQINDKKWDFCPEVNPFYATCPDSFIKIDDTKIHNNIIILDEWVGLLSHFFTATTEIAKHRIESLDKFCRMLKKALLVIVMDANLSDWSMKFFEHLDKPIFKIQNTYQAQQEYYYKILLGTNFKEQEKINKSDKRPMIADIINIASQIVEIREEIKNCKDDNEREKLKQSIPRMVIPCDSQKFGETLDKLLTKLGLKVNRIDRKTSKQKPQQAFLENPNEYLEANDIDVLIYSPSAESGLNVSIVGYFKFRFCFFFGVGDVNLIDSTTQMIKRVREDIPTLIWAADKAVSYNRLDKVQSNLKLLEGELDTYFNSSKDVVLDDETLDDTTKIQLLKQYKENKNFYYEIALNMINEGRKEKQFFRQGLLNRFESIGIKYKTYIVDAYTHMGSLDSARTCINKARDERNTDHAKDIFEVVDPTWSCDEFDHNIGKWESDLPEDHPKFWAQDDKAYLYNQLPGIQNTSIWGEQFINLVTCQDKLLVKHIEHEIRLHNPQLDKKSQIAMYKKIARGEIKDIWNSKKHQHTILIIDSLRKIGLSELIENHKNIPFKITDELPQKILKESKKYEQFLGTWRVDTKSKKKVSDQTRLKDFLEYFGYSFYGTKETTGERETLYNITRPLPQFLIGKGEEYGAEKCKEVTKQNAEWFEQVIPNLFACTERRLFKQQDKGNELSWSKGDVLLKTDEKGAKNFLEGQNSSNLYLEPDSPRLKTHNYLRDDNGFWDGSKPENELTQPAPAVPQEPEEYKSDEIKTNLEVSEAQIEELTPLQKEITAIESKPELEQLLTINGLEEVAAATPAPIAKLVAQLEDQNLTLNNYNQLIEFCPTKGQSPDSDFYKAFNLISTEARKRICDWFKPS